MSPEKKPGKQEALKQEDLGKLNIEAIQSRIVERILTGLRAPGGMVAAYRQSEGKNYGEYVRDGGSIFDRVSQPEIEQLARRIAHEEALRIQKEIGR